MIYNGEVLAHFEELLIEVFKKFTFKFTYLVKQDLDLYAIILSLVLTIVSQDDRIGHSKDWWNVNFTLDWQVFTYQIKYIST